MLISVTIIVFTQCIFLFRQGMFFDGVIYGAISRNLAEGKGSFWDPFFSRHGFWGHPPLVFWLESLFFRLFGDHFWVERLFSFVIFLVTAGILFVFPGRKTGIYSLIIFVSLPLTTWAYRNNMLDNVMGLFTLLSVVWLYDYLEKGKRAIPALFLAAACIAAGLLSKGPVALFPLGFPVLFACIYRRIDKRVILSLVVPVVCLALFVWGLSYHEPAVRFFRNYIRQQLLFSISGTENMHRLKPLVYLSGQLIVPVILTGLALVFQKKWVAPPRQAFLWGATALSVIIPLAISTKQAMFYLVPSLPFIALFFGSWLEKTSISESLSHFRNGILLRISRIILPVTILGGILYSIATFGQIQRDRNYLLLDHSLAVYRTEYDMLLLHPAYFNDWKLHAYLQRFGKWEYDMSRQTGSGRIALLPAGIPEDDIFLQAVRNDGFILTDTLTGQYHLYMRKDPASAE